MTAPDGQRLTPAVRPLPGGPRPVEPRSGRAGGLPGGALRRRFRGIPRPGAWSAAATVCWRRWTRLPSSSGGSRRLRRDPRRRPGRSSSTRPGRRRACGPGCCCLAGLVLLAEMYLVHRLCPQATPKLVPTARVAAGIAPGTKPASERHHGRFSDVARGPRPPAVGRRCCHRGAAAGAGPRQPGPVAPRIPPRWVGCSLACASPSSSSSPSSCCSRSSRTRRTTTRPPACWCCSTRRRAWRSPAGRKARRRLEEVVQGLDAGPRGGAGAAFRPALVRLRPRRRSAGRECVSRHHANGRRDALRRQLDDGLALSAGRRRWHGRPAAGARAARQRRPGSWFAGRRGGGPAPRAWPWTCWPPARRRWAATAAPVALADVQAARRVLLGSETHFLVTLQCDRAAGRPQGDGAR